MWVLFLLPLAFSMPFDLPKQASATYSDGFARTKILPLCAATDNKDPSLCLKSQFFAAQLKRRIDVPCSKYMLDRCVGYSAVETYDKAIMLAFKGTDGFLQYVMESEQTIFSNKTAWPGGGFASKYFADAFLTVWNAGMKDDFNTLKNQYPGYELWIAGHSLGGAMASLAASYIANTGLYDPNMMKVVTFGQPRTGDKDWAAAHDKAIAYSYRITHSHDIVPHLPLKNMEQYHHCLTEVFYNNNMTEPDFKLCGKEETLTCSDGQVDSSFKDHSWYFNTYVYDWGAAGCPP